MSDDSKEFWKIMYTLHALHDKICKSLCAFSVDGGVIYVSFSDHAESLMIAKQHPLLHTMHKIHLKIRREMGATPRTNLFAALQSVLSVAQNAGMKP